jgi:hypothetical protein
MKYKTPLVVLTITLSIGIGLYCLLHVSAATPFLSLEPEAGTLAGPATSVEDKMAANGKAVRFKSAANRTVFGACVANPGGTGAAAAATVGAKWGSSAAIRQFYGSDLSSGPVHPAGASIVQTSYRPDISKVNSGALDSQIKALINRTMPGDIIEFYHEPDNDGLDATGVTNMIAAKNRLYSLVQQTKPSVHVAATMTGGFFANYTPESKRVPWYGLKADTLGLDADGVHDSTGPTYDTSYVDEIAGVKAFMARNAANGWKYWTVPEFETSRQPWDTTGTPRADWLKAQARLFIDGGALAVMWYDYNTPEHNTPTDYGQIYSGTPEYTAFQSIINSNNK